LLFCNIARTGDISELIVFCAIVIVIGQLVTILKAVLIVTSGALLFIQASVHAVYDIVESFSVAWTELRINFVDDMIMPG
jgi:hypothetical protein